MPPEVLKGCRTRRLRKVSGGMGLQQLLTAFSTVACAVAFLIVLRRLLRRRSASATDWPPGPGKLPIIGNLHQLARGGNLMHHTLAELARLHGPAMTIWIGSRQPMIVVSNAELAWEVLVSKSSDYASRIILPTVKAIFGDFSTITTSNAGSSWNALKRGLQNGPLGPSIVSAQTEQHEKDLLTMIGRMKQQAAETKDHVIQPLSNIRRATIRLLSHVCFGARVESELFVESLDEILEATIKITSYGSLAEAFPFASFLPSVHRRRRMTLDLKSQIAQVFLPYLQQSPPTHSFLHVLRSQHLPEDVIISNIYEMFLLGVDSTASTIVWALAFLIHHQNVQEKVYKEIVNQSGGSLMVKMEDVGKLHYLQAVVKETMRMKPIAPMAVPHSAAKDTKLKGRRVGKGTRVTVNIHALHYDPEVWEHPDSFKPERFLTRSNDGDGGKQQSVEQWFIPFGAGLRTCAGMELGKLQVALALGNLVRAFKWSPEIDGDLPDLSEQMLIILTMKNPLRAKIEPRD
ncbi:piperic acid synthase CYP719A37-like [Aristolochia californica]|uniref:piperic acid synthase CYP719A37-like n=1 Tax=Aristolochia californica TaxID=171875 RepID=UPI0035DFFE8C